MGGQYYLTNRVHVYAFDPFSIHCILHIQLLYSKEKQCNNVKKCMEVRENMNLVAVAFKNQAFSIDNFSGRVPRYLYTHEEWFCVSLSCHGASDGCVVMSDSRGNGPLPSEWAPCQAKGQPWASLMLLTVPHDVTHPARLHRN